MVVGAVVDQVLRDERRHDDGRDTRAVLLEVEPVLVHLAGGDGLVPRGRRAAGYRRLVVVEAAVLIPGHDEKAGVPQRGAPQRLVGRFDQCFTGPHVIKGMLGLSAAVGVAGHIPVVRLDEGELRRVAGRGDVGCERAIGMGIPGQDSLQRAGDGETAAERPLIAVVDAPGAPGARQRVEQAAVFKTEAVDGHPLGYLRDAGAVVQPAG